MLPKPTTDKRVSLIVGIIFAVCVALVGVTMATLLISDNNISVRDMAITNVTDTAFSVTWVSDEPYVGGIVFQDNDNWPVLFAQSGKSVVFDDRDVELDSQGVYRQVDTGAKARYTHHITLRGLKPETQYFFRVTGRMNGKVGDIKSATTQKLREDLKTPDPFYGKVEGENLPQDDGFVILNEKAVGQEEFTYVSAPLSPTNTYSFDVTVFNKQSLKAKDYVANLALGKSIRLSHGFTQDSYKPAENIVIQKASEPIGQVLGTVRAQGDTCTVGFLKVNVRSSSSINSSVLKTLDPGTVVGLSIDSVNSDGYAWRKLANPDAVGIQNNPNAWVATGLFLCQLPTNTNQPSPPSIPEPQQLQVSQSTTIQNCQPGEYLTTSKLNFRSTAAVSSSNVISLLEEGEKLNLITCYDESWARVEYNGAPGYVSMTYIQRIEPNPIAEFISQVTTPTETNEYFQQLISNSTQVLENANELIRCAANYGGRTEDYRVSDQMSIDGYSLVGNIEVNGRRVNCHWLGIIDIGVDPIVGVSRSNLAPISYLAIPNFSELPLAAREYCVEAYGGLVDDYVQPQCVVDLKTVNLFREFSPRTVQFINGEKSCISLGTTSQSDVRYNLVSFGWVSTSAGFVSPSSNPANEVNAKSLKYIPCMKYELAPSQPQSSTILPKLSASSPADPKALRGKVLGAGTDQRLELTESGRYAFFTNGERIAEQDIVVRDGQVEVRLFNDDNGNGIKDEAETYFSDYTQITFAKEATAEEFSLTSGWNLIHLPLIDTRTDGNVGKASDLIDYWNGQGADIKHVARFRGGNFQIFSKRESGTEFAQDFDLIPGEGLFVLNLGTNVNVTFSGNRFESSVPVKLNQGWNLVGIMAPGKSYNSEQSLASMKAQGFSADTISQFEGGTYQSVISKDDTIFGNNFNITDKRGYFVRVETGGGSNYDPGK